MTRITETYLAVSFKCLRENKICETEDFNADLLQHILEPRDVQPLGRLPQTRIYSVTTWVYNFLVVRDQMS